MANERRLPQNGMWQQQQQRQQQRWQQQRWQQPQWPSPQGRGNEVPPRRGVPQQPQVPQRVPGIAPGIEGRRERVPQLVPGRGMSGQQKGFEGWNGQNEFRQGPAAPHRERGEFFRPFERGESWEGRWRAPEWGEWHRERQREFQTWCFGAGLLGAANVFWGMNIPPEWVDFYNPTVAIPGAFPSYLDPNILNTQPAISLLGQLGWLEGEAVRDTQLGRPDIADFRQQQATQVYASLCSRSSIELEQTMAQLEQQASVPSPYGQMLNWSIQALEPILEQAQARDAEMQPAP